MLQQVKEALLYIFEKNTSKLSYLQPEEYAMAVGTFFFFLVMYGIVSPLLSRLLTSTYATLSKKDAAYWNSCVMSNIHAIVVFSLSFYTYCIEDTYKNHDLLAFTPLVFQCNMFSLGYFIYDLVIVSINFPHLGGAEVIVHHILASTTIIAVCHYHKALLFMLLMFIIELSTPFVNQRWFFEKCQMKDSILYVINGLLMWLTFTLRMFMVGYMPYVMYLTYDEIRAWPYIMIVFIYVQYISISSLNIFWFSKITKGLVKAITGGSTTDKKAQ